jgi:FMN phosphatase YigB (HAD superfamily)
MNKVILTDCDGVLLNWEASFTTWMAQKGYNKVDADEYDVAKSYSLSKAESKPLVRQFNESAWMGYLPALRDARSGVAKLVELGYEFVCITSLSLDENAKKARVKNLQAIFGEDVFTMENVVCLDTGADKDEALAEYAGLGLYWIEDKTENAKLGVDLGLKTILVNHGHNQDCDNTNIKRVANWAEIVSIVTNS